MNNSIKTKDIVPLIKEVVDQDSTFSLKPKGISMLPTINEKTDVVILSKPEKLKKYDAVLYVRDNGQYVLHRIVKIKGDTFSMCGDNQIFIEKNIKKENIIAKMTSLISSDKKIDIHEDAYKKRIRSLHRKKILPRFALRVKNKIKRVLNIKK